MNKPGTKIVILTLTNSCNLACTYCYEHNKEAQVMTLETARAIVDREMTAEDAANLNRLRRRAPHARVRFFLVGEDTGCVEVEIEREA